MDKDLDVMDVDGGDDKGAGAVKGPLHNLDLEDLQLDQGGHFMANKHCELPKDTVKLTRKVRVFSCARCLFPCAPCSCCVVSVGNRKRW